MGYHKLKRVWKIWVMIKISRSKQLAISVWYNVSWLIIYTKVDKKLTSIYLYKESSYAILWCIFLFSLDWYKLYALFLILSTSIYTIPQCINIFLSDSFTSFQSIKSPSELDRSLMYYVPICLRLLINRILWTFTNWIFYSPLFLHYQTFFLLLIVLHILAQRRKQKDQSKILSNLIFYASSSQN